MKSFYQRVIEKAGIAPADTVLAICGGKQDRDVLVSHGVKNAVISNLDFHAGVKTYDPYEWAKYDAELIDAADRSFDWVIVHAGLHHCLSPHKAVCEMLRVARKGITIVEARDSLLMRVCNRLGLATSYELEPAAVSGGTFGGLRNGSIPNFVYRWTEREIEKTVATARPWSEDQFEYVYGYRFPVQRFAMSRSPLARLIVAVGSFASSAFEILAPKQGNNFGMIVRFSMKTKPWIKQNGGQVEVDLDYIRTLYDSSKYKGSKAAAAS